MSTTKSAKRKNSKPLRDKRAESLEDAGLWRRAASQWLNVLDATDDIFLRHALVSRRNYCLRMAVQRNSDKRVRYSRNQNIQ